MFLTNTTRPCTIWPDEKRRIVVIVSMENMKIYGWALGILVLSPIWGAFLWHIWEAFFRPRLINREEIVAKADELWESDNKCAFDIACAEEHRAWHYCDSFEQGRWRRIREEIMRRERARGATFLKVRG